MNVIDMRCRPPLPSLLETRLYDIDYATNFAKKFGGSYIAESAKNRSVPQLLQEMKQLNITLGVYEVRWSKTIDANQEALDFYKNYSNLFAIMTATDVTDIQASLQAIEQYTVHGSFTGVNLEPGNPGLGYNSLFIDDETLSPIYALCQDYDLPLTVTFGGCAYPDATAYMPHRVENVLCNFPKLRLGLCHGAWPWFKEYGGLMIKYPNLRIIPDSYIMFTPGYQEYIHAANYLLSEQLLFGTSYPYHDQQRVLDFYLKCGIRQENIEKILYYNAMDFLKLM